MTASGKQERPLKIVFVSHAGDRSGAPIVLSRLFEQALKEGEQAFLIFRYGGSWAERCLTDFGAEKIFVLPGPHLEKQGRWPNLLEKWLIFTDWSHY